MLRRSPIPLVALGIGIALLLLVSIALVERVIGYGEILPGVEVRGADVSGMTPEEARTELATMAPALESESWVAHHGDREFVLDPASIEYRVDPDDTVADARRQGRSRNPLDQLSGAVLRRFRPDVVALDAQWSQDRLDDVLDSWSDVLADGLQNGGLAFEGATVVELEPAAGIGLLREEAEQSVDDQLHSAARAEIELEVGHTEPEVDAEEVARAATEARAILAEPVVLDVTGNDIAISPEDLGATMTARARGNRLVLGIDVEALRSMLAPALAPFEVAPIDATFAVAETSVSVVPAAKGRIVDLDAAADEILAGAHSITARLRDADPARTTEWAQSLNITELVSSFTTNYTPGQPRVMNIRRAAELVNDTIVEPGAVFSLNDVVGPRTTERGFVEAPAFSTRDGFYEEVGGGVSQLSTTLFNATFFGGYEDIEHTPHSIYISRYPMGREATLNYGSIDNIFRNDSSSGILIRAYAGESSVTVSYYGNREGRVVEAEGPNILEEIPVEDEPVETPFLLEGETEPVPGEGGYTGYVVENFRTIKRPDQPDARERFVWTYDMRPRKIFVGITPRPPEPPPEEAPPPDGLVPPPQPPAPQPPPA